jgi:iron-sulfur cluster assembly accessory protein
MHPNAPVSFKFVFLFKYSMNMETMILPPVVLTHSAIKEIKRLMAQAGFDQKQILRVGVKGGGCSGMTYVLDFETPNPSDEFFEIEGIHCMISPAHAIYLMGMQIDWEGGLNARGFVFTNPNATKTCGCGTSFAV